MDRVVGLVNKLQQISTQLGDVAGSNSVLVDKLSSIVVVGGQVRPATSSTCHKRRFCPAAGVAWGCSAPVQLVSCLQVCWVRKGLARCSRAIQGVQDGIALCIEQLA